MEALPVELRARSTSLNNLVWNIGWATSATFAGLIIQALSATRSRSYSHRRALRRGGDGCNFYAAAFRRASTLMPAGVPEEAKGRRGEGPFAE